MKVTSGSAEDVRGLQVSPRPASTSGDLCSEAINMTDLPLSLKSGWINISPIFIHHSTFTETGTDVTDGTRDDKWCHQMFHTTGSRVNSRQQVFVFESRAEASGQLIDTTYVRSCNWSSYRSSSMELISELKQNILLGFRFLGRWSDKHKTTFITSGNIFKRLFTFCWWSIEKKTY